MPTHTFPTRITAMATDCGDAGALAPQTAMRQSA